MREVIVGPEAKSVPNRALNEEILQTISQGVKVYRTRVYDPDKRTQNSFYEYEFVTTSKDVVLWLAALSWKGQLHLGRLLDEEVSTLARAQGQFDSLELLLFYGSKDRAWHVTCSEHTNLKLKFVLAPAH